MFETWDQFRDVLTSRTILGLPLLRWLVFLGLVVLLASVIRVGLGVARIRLRRLADRTKLPYDDYLCQVVDHTWTASIFAFAAFIALYFVELRGGPGRADTVERTVRTLALVVIFLQAGRWGMGLIDEALRHGFRFANFSETAAQTAHGVVRFFALAGVWTIVAILILGSFGIEITPLLAGLGVGGVAVAFALQQILGDIFCSVAIVLDKPFEVGDFIISGEHMGSVEHIGVKTTRVRSLGGEQIVFPNSDLIGSRVRNYKRMLERRVVFSFGVLYGTKAETLEAIPKVVREIVEGQDQTRFDRAHFAKFGDSSLDFEVVYYVLSPDYNLFMDIQQAINLALFRRMEELGVGFAFPSRSLYVEGNARPFRTEVLLREGSRPRGGDGA
ncbi:mechanosensitive ion channel family protein [Tautonia plasticadhaerens]|uniref:Low conductance mechanosensitive channel YnaI n=1 Tax=Tautonia plasticadhaerens TaxID=2527974 RepID=A0A518H3U0_9BACT|nr:mechanosensitive ion channel family protein [Tautonia plasticadhaerens]QDV35493.1 Low conductance mechanosensitive channel YnaI [Tautonia plasticadhaerens]